MYSNLEAEQARRFLSNQNMADFLGISRKNYEDKKKYGNFRQGEIVKMLNLFKVTFEYLFEETSNNEAATGGA